MPQSLDGGYGSASSLWVDPSGDVRAGGARLVHGHGAQWTVEDGVGAAGVRALGGVAGLVWAWGD